MKINWVWIREEKWNKKRENTTKIEVWKRREEKSSHKNPTANYSYNG